MTTSSLTQHTTFVVNSIPFTIVVTFNVLSQGEFWKLSEKIFNESINI